MESEFILPQNFHKGILVFDEQQHVLYVNQVFYILTGLKNESSIEKHFKHSKNIEHALHAHHYWQGEISLDHFYRQTKNLFLEIFRVIHLHEYIDILIINLDFKSLFDYDDLKKKVYMDSLTGLRNQYFIEQKVHEVIKTKKNFAFFYLDLDGFKKINDLWGHQIGDELLKIIALRLSKKRAHVTCVARLHGDEFAFIVDGPEDKYEKVADDILSSFKNPFAVNSFLIHISASIGISLYPKDGKTMLDVINHADEAMFNAKLNGFNTYSFYDAEQHLVDIKKQLFTQQIEQAFLKNQFELFLQPIFNCNSQIFDKAEVFIRWTHPTKGVITPVSFLPLIKNNELVIDLHNWMFHEICRHLPKWQQFFPNIQISINTPYLFFQNMTKNIDKWMVMLKKNKISPQSIILEIMEDSLMKKDMTFFEKLQNLQKKGFFIALDDFGIGNVSLLQLKKTQVNFLKINHYFTQNIDEALKNQKICQSIIDLAHRLNIQVIAKDVENQSDQKILEEIGVDFVQGYITSYPLNLVDFENFLKNKS